MATDNTAEIVFSADTTDLNDALADAADGLSEYGEHAQSVFHAVSEANDSALQVLTAETQTATVQMGDAHDRAAMKAQASWNAVASSISRTFSTSVEGIVLGTETVQQAIDRLGQNILSEFVETTIQKMVTQWIAGNTTIESAVTALDTFLGISSAANAAVGDAAAESMASDAVRAYAAQGAAGAIAATAAIPLVGPELAPAAGAAIYADIMSFEIASAAGGWMVPSDQLAMVHENERILPARYSAGLDAMVGAAANGGGAAGHTFNNTFHINGAGVDAAKIPGMISSHLEKQMRNGAYGTMRR